MPPQHRQNLSHSFSRLKKGRRPASQSSKLLSEWEEVEEEWCNQECNTLSRAVTQPESTSASPYDDIAIVHNDDDDAHMEICPSSASEESEVETNYDDESQSSVSSGGGVVSHIIGDMNRRRRIRENAQWAEVIKPMFKAFMKCKLSTGDWSDPQRWNHDFKAKCRCPIAKIRVRQVDLFDILSKPLFASFISSITMTQSVIYVHFSNCTLTNCTLINHTLTNHTLIHLTLTIRTLITLLPSKHTRSFPWPSAHVKTTRSGSSKWVSSVARQHFQNWLSP